MRLGSSTKNFQKSLIQAHALSHVGILLMVYGIFLKRSPKNLKGPPGRNQVPASKLPEAAPLQGLSYYNLEGKVAQNNRPPYPKVAHNSPKVATKYGLLAFQVCSNDFIEIQN